MVALTTSSCDKLWRAMLSCFSLDQPTAKAGYLVRSMRWIPGLRKNQFVELPREPCCDQVEKDTATLKEERGAVTSAEEGHDVDRRCASTSSRTRCPLVNLSKMLDELDIGGDDELLPAQGGAENTEERVLAS